MTPGRARQQPGSGGVAAADAAAVVVAAGGGGFVAAAPFLHLPPNTDAVAALSYPRVEAWWRRRWVGSGLCRRAGGRQEGREGGLELLARSPVQSSPVHSSPRRSSSSPRASIVPLRPAPSAHPLAAPAADQPAYPAPSSFLISHWSPSLSVSEINPPFSPRAAPIGPSP